MIKTEKGHTTISAWGSKELEKDFVAIVRTIHRGMKNGLHKSEEEAKARIREIVEVALDYSDKEEESEVDIGEKLKQAIEEALKESLEGRGNPRK